MRVLEFLKGHPHPAPLASCRELQVSLRTWYASIKRLDDLGLILVERHPGGHKIRRVEVTPLGISVLGHLEPLQALLGESAPALHNELERMRGSGAEPRVGETLSKLIENAQRRGDLEELHAVALHARAAHRDGEVALALAAGDGLLGEMASAASRAQSALSFLEDEGNSLSYRHALALFGAALGELGENLSAYEAFSKLRGLARDARDDAAESDAWLGIGRLKAERGQMSDALLHFRRAEASAERAHSVHREARALAGSSLVLFIFDRPAGLAQCETALGAARRCGDRVVQMQAHANKSFMLAVEGQKEEALAELALARRMARGAGHEGALRRLKPLAALVKGLLQNPAGVNGQAWRDEAVRWLVKPEQPTTPDPAPGAEPWIAAR